MLDRSAHPGRISTLASFLFLAHVLLMALPNPAVSGPYSESGHAGAGMVAWATAVDELVRGPVDIAQPGMGTASLGVAANLLGAATGDAGDVVSLGDGGHVTLYFGSGIPNGPGDDLAIFENGFPDLFLGHFAELAFVEVSSDGIQYARFETHSLNGSAVGPFDYLDPTDYSGFAGRHELGIGTGFDLGDLAGHSLVQTGHLDLFDIQYVRVIDVIGDGSTTDSQGNAIYDPYSTPFAASGFDLEAVGVIHQAPEPAFSAGLLWGLVVLASFGRRSRTTATRTIFVTGIALLGVASPAAASTASFEDLGLGVEEFENGSGVSGGFSSGGIFFENTYSASEFGGQIFESFTGFAASTTTDNTTAGFGNQFSSFAGSGAGGSDAYALAFESGRIVLPTTTVVQSADFTNTTYAALSMSNGDSFAKKFGGTTGDDPDFFRLLIEGIDGVGGSTGIVELMLADYRFSDNSLDFIRAQWVTLDLTGLGPVKELLFSFESSDVGSFGINTPQYFAIDNLTTVPEPGTVCLLGLGLLALSGQGRRNEVARRTRR